jgi:hypothetical protein
MRVQKSLPPSEMSKLSSEQAWEIAGDFGKLLEEGKQGLYFFTDELPWQKGDILIALLKLIRMNPGNAELIEILCSNIAILDHYIPDGEEYQKLVELKMQIEKSLKIG